MAIKKVLLVGANGTLGTVLLDVLVASKAFDVSVLQRSNSASKPAHADALAQIIPVSPDLTLEELTTALVGQDAVVAAFPLKDVSQHLRLAEAAYRAGVQRFIPADFGSCDAASPEAQRHLKLYRDKTAVEEKAVQLAEGAAADSLPFSWTSLVSGHFFDFGLRDGLLHFNLDTQTAQILDAGDINASASTLARIGEAVVAVLKKPEETHNRRLYIQSFNPTQLDVLASLERATGTKWKTEHLESKSFLERESKRVQEGHHDAVEEVVFVLGTADANWTTREGFANELLGLKDQNLDEVVAEVVRAHQNGKAAK